MKDIDKEITAKQAELDALLAEKAAFSALNPVQQVAEYIHETICKANHTDGCGWFYSDWKRPCDTKKRYTDKARKLMQIEPDLEKVKAIVRAMKD